MLLPTNTPRQLAPPAQDTDDCRSTRHLATPMPMARGDLTPLGRERFTPSLRVILPRTSPQRVRRVVTRPATDGVEVFYFRSGSGGVFAGLLARLLRRLL